MSHRPTAPNLARLIQRMPTRLFAGRFFSEGSRALWGIVEQRFAGSAERLAKDLGREEASLVHLHLYGDRRPEQDARALYAERYGVPAEAWGTPAPGFRLPALRAGIERMRAVLADYGAGGLEIGALGSLCAFAADDCERDAMAIAVIYAMRGDGTVERIWGTTRWRLVRATRRKRTP